MAHAPYSFGHFGGSASDVLGPLTSVPGLYVTLYDRIARSEAAASKAGELWHVGNNTGPFAIGLLS